MKSAGYDIALLVNERFLNQLSGALYYSGFLTINGSVDFYKGKMCLEHELMDFRKEFSQGLEGNVPTELQGFLKMDFRFKLTSEPLIRFIPGNGLDDQKISINTGLRIYFFLWQGLEIKFDARISITTPIKIGDNLQLVADLENAGVMEMQLKYGASMKNQMTMDLDNIVENALKMYFANRKICQRIELPCISKLVKEVKQYIQPDKNEEGNDLGILPITLDAVKIVSPTMLALGINLMGYKGGDPGLLHEFAKNCSLAVAVSETAIFKVFSYVWNHSRFSRALGSSGNMWLVKDNDSLTGVKTGTLRVKKLDDFFKKVSDIKAFIDKTVSKAITGGFIEASTVYKGMEFQYGLGVTLKNEPKFDLLGGNLVSIYNMAFSVNLRLACYCTIEYKVEVDTNGWFPDCLTPWDDDITIYTRNKRLRLFDRRLSLSNLELKYGRGKLVWDDERNALSFEVEKINLYWNFEDPNSPLHGLPGDLINWITDQLEDDIVKKIPKVTVTPTLTYGVPYIPFPLKITGKNIEVTNSEVIMAADLEFEELGKSTYPVPKYIVNINNGEIHKIGCDSVIDTYEVHQRSYHLLSEALNHGYDGCSKCLPAFHKK
ncbi:hypothetical protein [Pseudobacteroides cellulosolvens]|uniref:Uncharacterized protein n=1 Tax=Pseudobacteroides cellulosolvens ATCC 35603 = DSM 2933 TaxID=398512 RepID=A0A0L6JWF6_9FIRM|nr:hypothetical protein [Pseudobacteroides cellulosolvens]KNY29950.1 hypothetical protein Bccel_5227 [Pseudobacteroides cellulosolvens ATCC 35603 = DSM 2933]